jgi:hypothetical protein
VEWRKKRVDSSDNLLVPYVRKQIRGRARAGGRKIGCEMMWNLRSEQKNGNMMQQLVKVLLVPLSKLDDDAMTM